MTGRTHDLAAFTLLSAIVAVRGPFQLSLSTLLLSILANLVGGIVPDIDQPTAPFWRNLPIGNIFGKVFGRLSGGHRFITHSIIGLAIFGFAFRALLLFISPILGHADVGYIWWSFIIGMVSHLFMDSFTKEGVPLLLPLPWHVGIPPLKRVRMVTGHKMEKLIVFPGLVLLCSLLYVHERYVYLNVLHHLQ